MTVSSHSHSSLTQVPTRRCTCMATAMCRAMLCQLQLMFIMFLGITMGPRSTVCPSTAPPSCHTASSAACASRHSSATPPTLTHPNGTQKNQGGKRSSCCGQLSTWKGQHSEDAASIGQVSLHPFADDSKGMLIFIVATTVVYA
jgi:hypothetical protein